MSETLTRPDGFRPGSLRPPMWSERQPPDVQVTNPAREFRAAAATISLIAMFYAQPCALVSSASEHAISRAEVRGTLQNSPMALTRKPTNLRINDFALAFNEAVELSESMVSDDEGMPLNSQTWTYAAQELISIVSALDIPLPLMLPLQNGGVGAEWHDSGLNIELRFRNPYQVYAVLEDARGIIPELQDYDQNLALARIALRELANRNLA